jgi:hypothetical protein
MHNLLIRCKFSILLAFAGVVIGMASLIVQGPLPGDVFLTRVAQAALGKEPAWAEFLTRTAKHPLVWVILIIGIGMAWGRNGWRGAAAIPAVFIFAQIIDKVLRALIYVPRPTSNLVSVASSSTSSGFPSTFALVYGAIFGTILLAPGRKDLVHVGLAVLSLILLGAGVSARVVLGGHWMSQIVATLLLVLSPAILVHWVVQRQSLPFIEQNEKEE